MKAKTELFLYELFWFGEVSLSCSLAKQLWSFEKWSQHHGLARQIQRLQNQAILDSERDGRYGRLLKLLQAPSSPVFTTDPSLRWKKNWEGRWTTVVFDIDEEDRPLRDKLRALLRQRKYGCLQRSVWVSAFADEELVALLKDKSPSPKNYWMTSGQDLLGMDPVTIAQLAWDFSYVTAAYQHELHALDALQQALDKAPRAEISWGALIRREHETWSRVWETDPFLPQALCPPKYLGPACWKRRQELLERCRSMGLGRGEPA
jgi:phenylacetic acid degradation operon negative regulatory protein